MASSTSRPLRVFLCYSSDDKPTVRELYHRLDLEGWIDVWLDEEKLYPGQDWSFEIEKAVESADVIIVCLTKSSVNKEGYIQRELRTVLDQADYMPEGTIFIIPVRLEECDPPRRLRAWQYANYFPAQSRDRSYQRLLVSLRNRANWLGILPSKPAGIKDNVEELGKHNAGLLTGDKISKAAKEKRANQQTTGVERINRQRAIIVSLVKGLGALALLLFIILLGILLSESPIFASADVTATITNITGTVSATATSTANIDSDRSFASGVAIYLSTAILLIVFAIGGLYLYVLLRKTSVSRRT